MKLVYSSAGERSLARASEAVGLACTFKHTRSGGIPKLKLQDAWTPLNILNISINSYGCCGRRSWQRIGLAPKGVDEKHYSDPQFLQPDASSQAVWDVLTGARELEVAPAVGKRMAYVVATEPESSNETSSTVRKASAQVLKHSEVEGKAGERICSVYTPDSRMGAGVTRKRGCCYTRIAGSGIFGLLDYAPYRCHLVARFEKRVVALGQRFTYKTRPSICFSNY